MDSYMKKVYDMVYSPIISPYNLLENAKLKNYNYVKYYSSVDGLVVEMECDIEGEGLKVFFYHFNKNDFLQQIFMESCGSKKLVFDRQSAINDAVDEYYAIKPELKQAI